MVGKYSVELGGQFVTSGHHLDPLRQQEEDSCIILRTSCGETQDKRQ